MTLTEILQTYGVPMFAAFVVIGSLIKIKPYEINLWGFIGKSFSDAFLNGINTKIDKIATRQEEIEKKLDEHIEENKVSDILDVRKAILNFGREILAGTRHTKEEFIEVLDYIDKYEHYCDEHPDFPNNRCLFAIDLIKDNYHNRLEKADFADEVYRKN